jgi:hypothetical protein
MGSVHMQLREPMILSVSKESFEESTSHLFH